MHDRQSPMKTKKNFFSEADLRFLRGLQYFGKWEEGRQGSGYMRMELDLAAMVGAAPLCEELLRFMGIEHFPVTHDAFLIALDEGASTPKHRDPITDGKIHFRTNVLLQDSTGGSFYLEVKYIPQEVNEAIYFLPSEQEHWVTPVEEGTRLFFSVGYAAFAGVDRGVR